MAELPVPLKFGLIIASDEPADRSATTILDEHIERAVAARDAGIGMLAVNHRYSFGPASSEQSEKMLYTWRFQPLLLLAHLSALFGDSVEYCTAILLSTSAHPVQLAEEVATLDSMCRGRLRLGLGLGWMPYEFQAFGTDFGQRAARFTELVQAYRALSTQDVVNYPGKFFDLSDVRIIAHGPQRPMAPLWLGASTDVAIRRAARLADAWVMSAHIELSTLRRQQAVYDQARSEAGLPAPQSRPIVRMLAIAEDRETAVDRIRPTLEQWYRERGEWGWFIKNAKGADAEKLGGGRWIVGDPDDCVAQIKELRQELGATDIIFGMNWPGIDQPSRLTTINLLKHHVLPRLRT